jgi:hypothetical protein
MSKCLTQTPDGEENDDTQLIPKSIHENTRSTPKLDHLRPRTVGVGAKDLALDSHKSSISTSSSEKKRKEHETDDENKKQIQKKKKPRHAVKKH